MLSVNCTEALSIQANVTISCSSAKLIKNGIAPLPFPLPALLQPYWYIQRGAGVRVRGHAQFYATLGSCQPYHYLPKSSRTATIFGARNLFRRNVSSDNTHWTIPQPCSLINLPAD